MCTALSLNSEGALNSDYFFLEKALEIKQWKASEQAELTAETFSASMQSMEAMMKLARYVITHRDF